MYIDKIEMNVDAQTWEVLEDLSYKYNQRKYDFYANPYHWTNNKRKLHGLHTIRKPINNKSRTRFSTNWVWMIYEELVDKIEKTIEMYIQSGKLFEDFVDIRKIELGDKVW